MAPQHSMAQGVSGPTVSDSKVGYIDNAIPGNMFRLRYDTAYNLNRPSRAEFFYAQNAPLGPGVPLPERSIDYQDASAYAEVALLPQFSVFLDLPTRFLNPEINANSAGLSDLVRRRNESSFDGSRGRQQRPMGTRARSGDG